MISYFTKLTGVSFRQKELSKVVPGKTKLRVIAQTDNEYDKYACEVQALLDTGWTQIGWIAKGKNQEIWHALMDNIDVSIKCSDITGEDKETLGCNVAIEYDRNDSVATEHLLTVPSVDVVIGDEPVIYFDDKEHIAYDSNGKKLLSGSMVEDMFKKPFDPTYPAKALAKTTGAKYEDIIQSWEYNRDLSADFGTLVHKSLENYYTMVDVLKKIDTNKERTHTATHWMPYYLGDIVDKFVKISGITEAKVEARIKWKQYTGIIDNLSMNEDGSYNINDYKITSEIKEVKYDVFGKLTKYSLQQNLYREILESNGLKVKSMILWQYNCETGEWSKHELNRVNVMEVVDAR